MSEFDQARKHMVDSQIHTADVTDRRLLAALEKTPRHLFAPKSRLASAYADIEVEIADRRYMMRPRVLAKLIQAADVRPGDLVLDIACGRGYSTALLSQLAEMVVGLEADDNEVDRATAILAEIGRDNAAVIKGDLKAGAPRQGPYDVIFVNGGVEEVPTAWFDQLKPGGRLVVVRRNGPVGQATLFTKSEAGIGEREVFDAVPALLPGFEARRRFAL